MYAPRTVRAEPFAVLPESLRSGPDAGWKADHRPEDRDSALLEGVVFDAAGRLFCVDTVHGRVLTVDERGRFDVAVEYDGLPLGLKFDRRGRLFAADFRNGIVAIDPDRGCATDLIPDWGGEPFLGVNDLTFASDGTLYFTDQGASGLHDPIGRVFRYGNQGELECLLDTVPSPNGLVLSLDEEQLFVAATRGNAIWRVPFDVHGRPTKVGIAIQMSGGTGPDGITLDSAGRLAVAHVGRGSVWIFDEVGDPELRIDVTGGRDTTNVAYDPGDPDCLVITEAKSATISRAHTGVPGRFIGPWGAAS